MICPICNTLENVMIPCENCGDIMIDQGRICNFYDNYSSYLDFDITEKIDNVDHTKCVHLYHCKSCDSDKRVAISKI